jgi:hypothetical protein
MSWAQHIVSKNMEIKLMLPNSPKNMHNQYDKDKVANVLKTLKFEFFE